MLTKQHDFQVKTGKSSPPGSPSSIDKPQYPDILNLQLGREDALELIVRIAAYLMRGTPQIEVNLLGQLKSPQIEPTPDPVPPESPGPNGHQRIRPLKQRRS